MNSTEPEPTASWLWMRHIPLWTDPICGGDVDPGTPHLIEKHLLATNIILVWSFPGFVRGISMILSQCSVSMQYFVKDMTVVERKVYRAGFSVPLFHCYCFRHLDLVELEANLTDTET
jgi:hypothetical protein